MGLGYHQRFLRCRNACAIPLPHPTLEEIESSLRPTAKEDRTAIFVCPYCGLVSEYSGQDIHELQMVNTPSLFQAGECVLVSIEVECDGKNCAAPKTIHAIQGAGAGTWKPMVAPRDWIFSETALCGAGHKLRFDESAPIHRAYLANSPL